MGLPISAKLVRPGITSELWKGLSRSDSAELICCRPRRLYLTSRRRRLAINKRAYRARQLVAATSSPNFLGRSSSFGAESGLGIPTTLSSSPIRSSFPSACDDEQDESSFLNAICYPEVVVDDPADELSTSDGNHDTPACSWPRVVTSTTDLLPSTPLADVLDLAVLDSSVGPEDVLRGHSLDLWRQGAAEAVLRAEEKYRQAWEDLQRAEIRLLSTRRVASELNALPEAPSFTPAVPLSSFVDELEDIYSGGAADEEPGFQSGKDTCVDLNCEDGVWCIEACRPENDALVPSQVEFGRGTLAGTDSAKDELLDAEGAIAKSRAALDIAARDLIARLEEEEDLQAQVMNRHIEVLDQGAQHQVARWLVDEFDAAARLSEADGNDGADGVDPTVALAVPLDLDLAMRGYDEHAVRFLKELPYDEVLKIRTIPPSEETRALSAAGAVADRLERLLAQDSAPPAVQSLEAHNLKAVAVEKEMDPKQEAPCLSAVETAAELDRLAAEVSRSEQLTARTTLMPKDSRLEGREGTERQSRNKYHSKLVLLGCAISTLAAYMVANFELVALAKDVSVIVVAMSLAFLAAHFVWKSSSSSREVQCSSPLGKAHLDSDEDLTKTLADHSKTTLVHAGPDKVLSRTETLEPPAFLYRRGPSWDQVIWFLGGVAVVLSLSTMVALACKAVQMGITALSAMACSLVLSMLPGSLTSAASAALVASERSLPSLVKQVSSSLWLVVGGELLSSGVEVLGSAAAWAMLLLCVAFSIASAPVCIASSTSRRVHELLALARGHSGPQK